jgi:L-alanine-DL-glutamate epimerase-like enolase superfamily enzyme
MEITGFRFEMLSGTLDVPPADLFEDRFARPVDRYEEFRSDPHLPWWPDDYETAESMPVRQVFLFVETDAGVTGMAGPMSKRRAREVRRFERHLVGQDPLATEKLWDLMYRKSVHGRKGQTMIAISIVDVALWDLKGTYLDEAVHRLLGGPTRESLPAYASMLGADSDPAAVRERAADVKKRGYDAQKWFFRHGLGSGREGKDANEALAAAAREAVGEDYDLMFDAWMSWDRTYALDMFDRLAPHDPRWVEEPVQPDKIRQYAALRDAAPFPIAGGEHEYTRWGVHDLLDRGAVDVMQADTYWAGGITELRHATTLASVYDVPLIPHGLSVPANVQITAAAPANVSPLVEYLVRADQQFQFFFENPIEPDAGEIPVPDRPGIGVSIDDGEVESREPVRFD